MDTTNGYKNSTENVSQVNNKASDCDIIKGIVRKQRAKCDEGCISNLTHPIICEHQFLTYIGTDTIVNKKLLGGPCEAELRHNYNHAINEKKFYRCYEIYEDIHLQMQTNNITKNNHYCECKDANNNHKRLEEIQMDFETYLGEKTYTPDLKTVVQCHEYFKKQGCQIEETKQGITIKFPPDRDFTLLDEMRAIRVIAKERAADMIETINFKDHSVTIQNRDIMESD